jgi:hypothetical protein
MCNVLYVLFLRRSATENTYSVIATENLLRFILFYIMSRKIIVDFSGLMYYLHINLCGGRVTYSYIRCSLHCLSCNAWRDRHIYTATLSEH